MLSGYSEARTGDQAAAFDFLPGSFLAAVFFSPALEAALLSERVPSPLLFTPFDLPVTLGFLELAPSLLRDGRFFDSAAILLFFISDENFYASVAAYLRSLGTEISAEKRDKQQYSFGDLRFEK
jgi:hypothetical protein